MRTHNIDQYKQKLKEMRGKMKQFNSFSEYRAEIESSLKTHRQSSLLVHNPNEPSRLKKEVTEKVRMDEFVLKGLKKNTGYLFGGAYSQTSRRKSLAAALKLAASVCISRDLSITETKHQLESKQCSVLRSTIVPPSTRPQTARIYSSRISQSFDRR